MTTMTGCPTCGGEVQGTSRLYWSLVDNEWQLVDASEDELAVYCENDDVIEDHSLHRSLGDAVIALGTRVTADRERYLIRAGLDPWKDDSIQFPRLLAEIAATVELRGADYAALGESMDLTPEQIDELFDRAQQRWQGIVANRVHRP
jgi:hypothetical protein